MPRTEHARTDSNGRALATTPGTLRRAPRLVGDLVRLELGVVLLASPLLLFPSLEPTLCVCALVALVIVWLARWGLTGQPVVVTPLNVPLLLLLAMVPVAALVSPAPALTLPKLTGLVLGLSLIHI